MEEVEPGEESSQKCTLLQERIADLETWLVRERVICEQEFVRIKERETEGTLRWLSELETAGMDTSPAHRGHTWIGPLLSLDHHSCNCMCKFSIMCRLRCIKIVPSHLILKTFGGRFISLSKHAGVHPPSEGMKHASDSMPVVCGDLILMRVQSWLDTTSKGIVEGTCFVQAMWNSLTVGQSTPGSSPAWSW